MWLQMNSIYWYFGGFVPVDIAGSYNGQMLWQLSNVREIDRCAVGSRIIGNKVARITSLQSKKWIKKDTEERKM